ncbi:MAG: hypothetical protein ABF780_03855 [Bifidobacterium aquikefiri]|uniref:Condensation domain-containing protein n=2 Tax=Bifidobacterium aquikefiri TaxID=1653207 RepID=A0A261G1J3_9BIFI|nr:hypothetical protein BAQU_1845 [Bifidobacterium aquikefiri]
MKKIRSGQSFLYRAQGYKGTVLEARMKDRVDGKALQTALDHTVRRFPDLTQQLVLKGADYYLAADQAPMKATETLDLRPLGGAQVDYHLVDVTFTVNAIRISFHHALCDGRGIKPFMETLLFYYCSLKYNTRFSAEGIHTVNEFPDSSETQEPISTLRRPVDSRKLIPVITDGFQLPEATATPNDCRCTEIQVDQNNFVRYAKEHGATPAIMVAMMLSHAIWKLHSNTARPIVCSMAVDLRAAAGFEHTRRNCTGSFYLPYSTQVAHSDQDETSQEYRSLIAAQRSPNMVNKSLNMQTELFNKLDSLPTFTQKQQFMSMFDHLIINTYVLSYVGRMQCNDFATHIDSVHLYSSDVKGMTVNMTAAADTISFDVLQGFRNDAYAKAFIEELEQAGIATQSTATFSFDTGHDESCVTASSHLQHV